PEAMDRSLKKLFATGLFADVVVHQQGPVLVVRVVENPIINRIAFEGNKRLDDDSLRPEIKLRPRIVYTRTRVRSDVQRIIDIYRRTGRFAATVEPKVIQLPQNRVDLVFEIDEGALTEIRRITFIGNRQFDDGDLRRVIQTKESAWYRFLTSDDTYDPDRLTFDRELLRRFYLSEGYADFRVISAVAELAPNRSGFFITFTVEEGNRYKFGKTEVVTTLRDLKADQIQRDLPMAEGEWYDADKVEETIKLLTSSVGNLGYAFVDIRPQVRRDRKTQKIDVTFNVQEGPRVFVERINITGNVRTIDPVIRREFSLVEGDAFNAAKMRRSRRGVRNLGFFEKVEISNVPGTASDKTIVNVSVQEKSTGEISFGFGFSSTAGVLGDIGIRERNLLGKGQDLFLRIQAAQRASEVEIKFTEPYFLERKLIAGFDIFRFTRDLQTESSFDKKSTGFGLRMGYGISDLLSQNLSYRLSKNEVKDVEADASFAIKEQEGSSVTSSIAQTLKFDTRDSRFSPTEGFFARWTADFAGLGGSVRYLRNRLLAVQYYPFPQTMVGSLSGGGGYIFGIADDVRLVDRFFLGGKNLRGFANLGVSPRDLETDDALGGNWFYNASAEVSFPLGLPDEFGIRGRVFSDLGSIGDVDALSGNVTDVASVRASVGVGFSWRSPVGPVSIDLAKPILKEDFDDLELVRFNFGTRF
ncbi:MAG: outer membrane protein assembly factor BamA, partial [Acidiferrobacterales bacterium]